MTPHIIRLPLSTLENMQCELYGRFEDLFDRLDDILGDLHDLKTFLMPLPSTDKTFDPLQTIGKY